jgi:hypothetical protein
VIIGINTNFCHRPHTWDIGSGPADCAAQLETLKPHKEISKKWFEVDKGEPGFQLHSLSYFLNKRSTMIFVDLYQHYLHSYILPLFSKKVVGLERGPLSLVSTTEELLDRKVAAPI